MYSTLNHFESIEECKKYYISEYCSQEIYTHTGMKVTFHERAFEHAFFERKNRRSNIKPIFSELRSERIDWIKKVLQDKSLFIYKGWDSKKRRYDESRRVTMMTEKGYVVVVRITNQRENTGDFVTAFIIDENNVKSKIRKSPVVYNPEI